MDIKYRALIPDDSLQYRHVRLESLKLHPDCFGSKYLEQVNFQTLYFERLIEEGCQNNIMLGAFHGTKLVGLCGVTPQSTDSANITQMYVESSYRGNSIGISLLSLAKKYASTELDVATLKLDVYPDNKSAIRSYEKSGFKIEDSMADLIGNEISMVFEVEK
ncbi:GNAT family N-acetyltransferase [Moritella sp. Urea-trap-13]|uniref:GNAT family N-acetyltransferase n=1 Tax=Moritella sp. Urea-trap-13 TaxID=2058327 RepID=UPI000C3267EE|nr:GNAT family N-acetyltransferase [Moritella sp. Urea-trap-13]PKH06896.1 GNAT family N-acetyltransferase [Moritella sp. Urea-trap-13]